MNSDGCEKPILVHVGLHKTGTTWLQQRYFSSSASGFTDIAEPIGRKRLLDALVRVEPYRFRPDEVSALLAPGISSAVENGTVPMLSHERLSGYLATGAWDRKELAERIRATFGHRATVLVVIREQASLIDTLYSQYVADGGALALEDFLSGPTRDLGRLPRFTLNALKYDLLKQMYSEIFGESHVLVLPHEMMRSDLPSFLGLVADHCGVHHWVPSSAQGTNARRPAIMQHARRMVNRVAASTDLNPYAPLHVKPLDAAFERLRPVFSAIERDKTTRRRNDRQLAKVRAHLGDFFAESNTRASAALGLDLASWGYNTGADHTDGQ